MYIQIFHCIIRFNLGTYVVKEIQTKIHCFLPLFPVQYFTQQPDYSQNEQTITRSCASRQTSAVLLYVDIFLFLSFFLLFYVYNIIPKATKQNISTNFPFFSFLLYILFLGSVWVLIYFHFMFGAYPFSSENVYLCIHHNTTNNIELYSKKEYTALGEWK